MDIEDEERRKLFLLKEIFMLLIKEIKDSTENVKLLGFLNQKIDDRSDLKLLVKTKQLEITGNLALYLFLGIQYLLRILKGRLTENEYQYLKDIFESWNIYD